MEKTQWYIGAPNGVILCADRIEDGQIAGRFYHPYSTEPTTFSSMDQMLFELENFYDSMNYPYPTTNNRSFTEKKESAGARLERTRIMSDKELLSKHGDLGTFIIRVQHRQNSSWQGRITWMDKNKTICFRSVWELIKLIASALDTVSVQEGEGEQVEVSWKDDEI